MRTDQGLDTTRRRSAGRRWIVLGRALLATAFLVFVAFRVGPLWAVAAAVLGVCLPLALLLVLRWIDQRRHPLGASGLIDFPVAELDDQFRSVRRGRLGGDLSRLWWVVAGSQDPEHVWPAGSVERWSTHPVMGGLGCVLELVSEGRTVRFSVSASRPTVRRSLGSIPGLGPDLSSSGQ